jgi:hypothetical protein
LLGDDYDPILDKQTIKELERKVMLQDRRIGRLIKVCQKTVKAYNEQADLLGRLDATILGKPARDHKLAKPFHEHGFDSRGRYLD